MRFLSVCSGIEAASVSWNPIGWNAVGFSEIESFPCAVLKHHYPHTPNFGDMNLWKEWPDATIDVLCGGTPCQSFSVAGLRKGLADPRGNLMLTFLAIAKRYKPKWVVWENVPGVLSSNGGRDFGSFLGGLAECGYGFAYRVLDAQYFGLPQRRKRVFVVGNIGDWHRAAAVLFERESLSGDINKRTKKQISETEIVGTVTTRTGISRDNYSAEVGHCIIHNGHPRWLTVTEVERLMGFPVGYTKIGYKNITYESCPDAPRYKALGNSWAIPVAKWVGARINKVEEWTS